MAVHDRQDVGTRPVDLAVDEALQIDAATVRIERVAVEVEGEYVLAAHQRRRHVAGKQKMPGRLVVADAYVSEAVDDTLAVKDAIGDSEPLHECRLARSESP